MRGMMLMVALLSVAAPAAAADEGATPPSPACPSADVQTVAGDGGAARLRRLDTLPPADEILTVLRTEGGCTRPVKVRYGIGGNPAAGAGEGSR